MTTLPEAIEVKDELDDPHGEFDNYDALNETQRDALQTQRHIDIRSFTPDKRIRPYMLHLDLLTMTQMDQSMQTLETQTIVADPGEAWSFGTLARFPSYNYWFGVAAFCPASTLTELDSVRYG